MNAAQKVMRRIEMLSEISDEAGRITRLFASPAMQRANKLAGGWMREAGMTTHGDAIGNLIGHYHGTKEGKKVFLLGSHLDTVRNAGKFDGPLGVMLAIACVENLHRRKIRLPFAIQVVAFADEEGVRFQTAYLGSKAFTGHFDNHDLARKDGDGISMREAVKKFGGRPARLNSRPLVQRNWLGYLEAHIEQGPVLEEMNLPVGIVGAIAGQTRCKVSFTGRAGHAGTTPMNSRRDALCAAAEFVLAAENSARNTAGLVATVGQIFAGPGVSNVIPGTASLTLDLRHQLDRTRKTACARLQRRARQIARTRKLKLDWQFVQETNAVACAPGLSKLLAGAVRKFSPQAVMLTSGAGHDAAIMSRVTPAAMLFIRCKNGVSHHPDESVKLQDVGVALKVMDDFLHQLAQNT
jgi:allantoate deiminase